ncbi:MAG: zinc-ribbon domain-containing protein [Anaerolineales bacterium]|nr:zinc-ribbon domain-containing protein [Anaerolineales bacterium]
MIIWGSKGKIKNIGSGQFYCPRCQSLRHYLHKEVGKYFTLYFIPLFQTEKAGEFIECQTCFTPFEKSVLDYDPKAISDIQDLVLAIQDDIEAGLPLNVIYQGMVENGASKDAANNIIAMATNGKMKVCNSCQLLYTATHNFCPGCGKTLDNIE